MILRTARFAELDPRTLYALLRLRVDVFVVEQACPYPELDGRDVEPGTVHLWLDNDDGPAAYLRIVDEPGAVTADGVATAEPDTVTAKGAAPTNPGTAKPGTAKPGTAKPGTAEPGTAKPGTAEPRGARIGRICTAVAHRGAGHSGRLLTAALGLVGHRHCVLNAQSYLTGFYARHGFRPTGPEFLDDGIPHVPMHRPPTPISERRPRLREGSPRSR
jgi:ElaA protein